MNPVVFARTSWGGLVFRTVVLGGVLGVVLGLGLLGACSASKEQARPASGGTSPSKSAAAPESLPPAALGAKPSASETKPAAKADPEGLKELSPDDRALAEKQAICPVSKEPLGSMGTPVKVAVGSQTVFLCCSGCEEDFRKDPQKYLAQMGAGKAPGHDGHDHAH